jgi:uncharacterized protein (DUF427 family)
MTQAIWNGRVVAESEIAEFVEGNHYFPADSVNWDLLQPNSRTTVCHWKGEASYYDITVEGRTNSAAAWRYKTPGPAARKIKDHVAFWHGVCVVRAPAAEADASGDAVGWFRRLLSGRTDSENLP